MRKNFEVAITDFDGKPIFSEPEVRGKEGTVEKAAVTFTLKSAAIQALNVLHQDEQSLPAEKKFERYRIAMKIATGDPVELNVDELALVKQLIGRVFTPIVVGRAWEILEKDSAEG
jgi:hypothetical protein